MSADAVGERAAADGGRARVRWRPPLPKLKSPIEIVIPNGFFPFSCDHEPAALVSNVGLLDELLVAVDADE